MALAGGWVSLPEAVSLGQDLNGWRICCWHCRERLSARVGRGGGGKGKIKGAWEPRSGPGFILREEARGRRANPRGRCECQGREGGTGPGLPREADLCPAPPFPWPLVTWGGSHPLPCHCGSRRLGAGSCGGSAPVPSLWGVGSNVRESSRAPRATGRRGSGRRHGEWGS